MAVHFFFLDKKETEPKKKSRLPGGGYFSVGFCVRKGTCTSCFGQPFLCYAKTGASVLRPHQEAGPRDATLLGLCPHSFLFVVCCNFARLRLCSFVGFASTSLSLVSFGCCFNVTRFARSLAGLGFAFAAGLFFGFFMLFFCFFGGGKGGCGDFCYLCLSLSLCVRGMECSIYNK